MTTLFPEHRSLPDIGARLINNIPVLVVSRLLGHSEARLTLDVYGHLYCEMQEGAADVMDKLLTPIQVLLPQEKISSALN